MSKNSLIEVIKHTFIKKTTIAVTIIILITTILFSLTLILANNVEVPVKIYNANDLDLIREDLSGYYLIMTDLNMKDYKNENGEIKTWVPVGTKEQPFSGKIDFNYKAITGLTFSNDYIITQIEDEKIKDILIGFLGYSNGTIIHTNFYKPVFPDCNELLSTNKTIIYGTICAVNEGFVTSCSCTIVGNDGTISANNMIFGMLIGENKKQALNNICSNTISIMCYGESVIGGAIGITYQNSIVSYIVRRGYTTVTYGESNTVFVGGVIGMAFGGQIDNLYHGPSNLNQRETLSIANPSTDNQPCILGGIIGLIDGEDKIEIKSVYSCNKLSLSNNINSFSVGGLIGKNTISNCKLDSCLSDSIFSIGDVTNNFVGIMVGYSLSTLNANNCYYIENDSISDSYDRSFCKSAEANQSLLKLLGWPTNTKSGYWSFNGVIFCLNIL